MSHHYALGYVEIGKCEDCWVTSHLFVHSHFSQDEMAIPFCRACISSRLRRSLYHIQEIDNRSLAQDTMCAWLMYEIDNPLPLTQIEIDTPTCVGCERLPTHHNQLVESVMADCTTIVQAHRACSFICGRCSIQYAIHPSNAIGYTRSVNVQNNELCADCSLEVFAENNGARNFENCFCCSTLVLGDDMRSFDDRRYCNACYEDNVYTCQNCDELCWENYDHYCNSDDDYDDDNGVIHNFDYKPFPQFFGDGKYYLGFELEVESTSNRYDDAQWAQDNLGAHAYMKSDGSLNDGFEIVTHPHTLESYQKTFNWKSIKKLGNRGCRSWNTTTCGIHVHVSRTAFGDSNEPKYGSTEWNDWVLKRQAHELRFMKLIYDNQRQVERISGRASSFARFDDKGNLVNKVKHGHQRNDRYSAVNTENENTLEVRVFKGSLRPERVLSALEFVHASVEYTRDLRVSSKAKPFSWLRFTSYIYNNMNTYANLALIMEETFQRDNGGTLDDE